MQIAFNGDTLHDMPNLFSEKDKKKINLPSAELAQRRVNNKIQQANDIQEEEVN